MIDDPVSIREDAAQSGCMIAEMDSGEYLVSGVVGGGLIARFSSDGRFEKTFGRPGEGPGELGTDGRVFVGPGDTMFVSDFTNRRLSAFGPSGALAWDMPIGAPTWAWLGTRQECGWSTRSPMEPMVPPSPLVIRRPDH
jgi:hypothetical protein